MVLRLITQRNRRVRDVGIGSDDVMIIRRGIQAGERLWIKIFGQEFHTNNIIWMVIKVMIDPVYRSRLDRRDCIQSGAVNKRIEYRANLLMANTVPKWQYIIIRPFGPVMI